jgi:hypothetical protein
MSISEKACPKCTGEVIRLRWSQNEKPPEVVFDTFTGKIQRVEIMRYCIVCGYKEVGVLVINQMPTFSEIKEGQ